MPTIDKMKTKLTDRQQRFVEEYVANGGNGTRAYRLVYPNATLQSAMTLSSKLLRDVKVQECVREARKKFRMRVTPTYKKLLHEYGKLAFSDISEVLDFETPGGPYLREGIKLSPEAAACIQSVEVIITTNPAAAGKSKAKGKAKKHATTKAGVMTTTRTRVRLHSKPDALHKIGLHIGMFEKLTPLEVFINALPPVMGRQLRDAIAASAAGPKDQPSVGRVHFYLSQVLASLYQPTGSGEPDPVSQPAVPVGSKYPGSMAGGVTGQHQPPPNRPRVSSGGEEFHDGGEDPPLLFGDP